MGPKPWGYKSAALVEHVRRMERVHRAMASFPVIPDTYKFTGVHPEYGGMGEIPDRLYVTPTEKVRYVYHDGYRRWSRVATALDSDVWPTPLPGFTAEPIYAEIKSLAEALPDHVQKRYAETKLRRDYYGTVTVGEINMSFGAELDSMRDKIKAELANAEWQALSMPERTAEMQAIYDGFNNRQKRAFAKLMGPGYCGVDTTLKLDPDYADLEKRTADIMYARYLEECRAKVIAPVHKSAEDYVLARTRDKTKALDPGFAARYLSTGRIDPRVGVAPIPTEIALMRDKFCTRLNKLFKGRARVSFPPPRSPDFTVFLGFDGDHLLDPPRLTFAFPYEPNGDHFSRLEDHVVHCVTLVLDGAKLA